MATLRCIRCGGVLMGRYKDANMEFIDASTDYWEGE